MSRGQKSNAVAVEIKRLVEIGCGGVYVAHPPFHELDGRGGGKNAAVGANVIGVRVGDATRFAVAARIEREGGIEQTDGFVVDEQSFLNF